MKIDRNIIKLIRRNPDKFKRIKLKQDEKLQKEFFTSLKNYEFKLTKESAYDIALWIDSNEKQLTSINQNNLTTYKIGDILFVDLGWDNYDREFAYMHPAIVIKETTTKIFIVPCTSSKPRKDKNGNIYPEFEIATTSDGFQKDTTVMLYEARYIDKNRVVSKIGKVSNDFFNKIYIKLFEQLFEPISYKLKKLEELNN